MRILFIHTQYTQLGGEDQSLQSEIKLLNQHGHSTDCLLFKNEKNNSFFENLKNGFYAFYNPQSFAIASKKIKDFKPDIVHIHNLFFKASPSVLYAAKKNNIPVVATIHNYRLLCSNALLLRNNKPCELCVHSVFPIYGVQHKCYHSSALASAMVTGITGVHKTMNSFTKTINTFITLTDFAKEKLLSSSLKLPSNKIVVQPNFTPDYGIGQVKRNNYFLFAGRLTEEKGIQFLLKAFSELPNEQLVVAGEGPLQNQLVAEYNACNNIVFEGKLKNSEIINRMKHCKALLFPSLWYEGLPLSIIEAFSTGTPVLASNLGAMATMIINSYNGLHFKPGSSTEIKTVVHNFNNLSNQEQLYANARQTFLNYYTDTVHYAALMKIYNHVLCSNQKKLK